MKILLALGLLAFLGCKSGAHREWESVNAFSPDQLAPRRTGPSLALSETQGLQRFALRSLRIGTPERIQFRVDLSAAFLAVDDLKDSAWVERHRMLLEGDRIAAIRTALQQLKAEAYPLCESCERDIHLLVLETEGAQGPAKGFAMSQACVCGESDERRPQFSYASLRNLKAVLDDVLKSSALGR